MWIIKEFCELNVNKNKHYVDNLLINVDNYNV